MEKNEWLSLSDYSRRYHVSVSTLRRRIKSDQVEHGYRNGKYFLKNKPLEDHGYIHELDKKVTIAPPQVRQSHLTAQQPTAAVYTPETIEEEKPKAISVEVQSEAPVLATANKLLNELKKAYTLILQEKEEQIIQLKEQVADLQTLVRVLEKQMSKEKEDAQLPARPKMPAQAKAFSSAELINEEELYITPTEEFTGLSEDPWLD